MSAQFRRYARRLLIRAVMRELLQQNRIQNHKLAEGYE